MNLDEGYVKYRSQWIQGPSPDRTITSQLERWRRPLRAAGLIGHYDDLGIGFGNISIRIAGGTQFVISGTQTGHLPDTIARHYTQVTDYDIDGNRLTCRGPIQASSESLTHAAIYELSHDIWAIVHVHSATLWNELRGQAPTTQPDVPYGTPEMALEFARLYRDTDFRSRGIAVMAGHEDGIVSIGESIEEAATRILQLHSESAESVRTFG